MALQKKHRELALTVIAIALGLFFMYAGGKKIFLPPAPRPDGVSTVPQAFIDLIRALKAAGPFMYMVGWLQFIAGALLLIRPTRLLGALLLAPITFNIFVIHVLLDNRWDEYLLTGLLLAANLLIVFSYFHRLWLSPKMNRRATA